LEAVELADNQEKKEHLVFQEYPVVLDLWENEAQLDPRDHLDHQEQTH